MINNSMEGNNTTVKQNSIFKDWKIVFMTIGSTLLLMIDYYYKITPWKALDRTILYFIIPFFIITCIFREKSGDYGFGFGDWKTGVLITIAAIILISPVLWLFSRGDPTLQGYYKGQLSGLPWTTFADLFGWEFIFRGWLLFGYTRKFGSTGLWLQAVPFALAHMGKPEIETLSTIFGGFAFGWVAWKTRSFVYPFLIHWFVASFTIIIASGFAG
jgi:membrane protease YdiL (CAAX protease family)